MSAVTKDKTFIFRLLKLELLKTYFKRARDSCILVGETANQKLQNKQHNKRGKQDSRRR